MDSKHHLASLILSYPSANTFYTSILTRLRYTWPDKIRVRNVHFWNVSGQKVLPKKNTCLGTCINRQQHKSPVSSDLLSTEKLDIALLIVVLFVAATKSLSPLIIDPKTIPRCSKNLRSLPLDDILRLCACLKKSESGNFNN